MRTRSLAVAILLWCGAGRGGPADAATNVAWLGDAGHFFVHQPALFANNPDGRAFTVTVHRHVWPANWANRGEYTVRVLDPADREVAGGGIPSGEATVTLAVPAGPPGVHQVAVRPGGYGLTWVQCSLPQLVIGCGPWDGAVERGGHARFYGTFILHVMAPRRWYFYVPPETRTFEVKHTILPFQSHREDYGFFVVSPRGQRMAAFFGGRSLHRELPPHGEPVVQPIEVDAGTAGRFWSIWPTGGDSHNFSDLQILLRGVPPYFAPTPEQWFDPTTGAAPPRLIYDDAAVRKEHADVRQAHYRSAPATFLGDEDYNGWRGPQTLFLHNPANRPLRVGAGTYIADTDARFAVQFQVTGPTGQPVVDHADEIGHASSAQVAVPAAGAGTYRLEVGADRWFPWTHPTTPIVIAGKPTAAGGARFELETGIARH